MLNGIYNGIELLLYNFKKRFDMLEWCIEIQPFALTYLRSTKCGTIFSLNIIYIAYVLLYHQSYFLFLSKRISYTVVTLSY